MKIGAFFSQIEAGVREKGYDGVFTMEICSLIDVYDKLLLSADRYREKIRNLS